MKNVEQILETTFNKSGWKVTKSEDGWEEGSYIGSLDQERYFVKFGINPRILQRLSDIKVTPNVQVTGNLGGQGYMVQDFIDGLYVPREWFGNNLKQLAEFVEIYHKDKELAHI